MEILIEEYSKPVKIEKTKLATIFWLNPRDSKKGRLFIPIYDERSPLKFKLKYSYISKFLEKNNTAGNHYHNIKEEILIPMQGKFKIHLEDIKTKEREVYQISASENKAIFVKTQVSHSVTSKEETGVLLVLASNPSNLEDEVEYKLS